MNRGRFFRQGRFGYHPSPPILPDERSIQRLERAFDIQASPVNPGPCRAQSPFHMKTTYFTIEPTESGFTDQLMQFNAFYKLGLHLGLPYVHTPFVSIRSDGSDLPIARPPEGHSAGTRLGRYLRALLSAWRGATPDVHEFIGFNRYFEVNRRPTLAECTGLRSKVIEMSDNTLLELSDQSFESLARHIGDTVRRFQDSPDAIQESMNLVKFRLEGPRGRLFSLIQRSIPEFQDGLDLASIYSAARTRSPIRSLFPRRGLKVVVHIRQGDTGVIQTPWNTYVPLWHVIKNRLKEHDGPEQIESSELLFQVSDYKTFLDGLLGRLERSGRTVLVFSDGASRAFRIIESNFSKLAWPEEKVRRFIASEAEYDRRQFRCFLGADDVRLHVGEDPMRLCQLINSAIEADVVIVSSQQRMIPKLVANFCGQDSPKVIVLYKRHLPLNSDITSSDKDRFIYFDVENPDYGSLMLRLQGNASAAG